MPSPYATTRWALFSPEPTQITLGFFGSMVIAPVANDPSPSKIGVNVSPALTDFHTPPAAVATYHVFLSVGSTATSEMRPDTSAGPMDRNFRLPASVASLLVSDAGDAAGGAAGLEGCCCANACPEERAASARKVGIRMRPIYPSCPLAEVGYDEALVAGFDS